MSRSRSGSGATCNASRCNSSIAVLIVPDPPVAWLRLTGRCGTISSRQRHFSGDISMNPHDPQESTTDGGPSRDQDLSPERHAEGRRRVAQLLGELIAWYWLRSEAPGERTDDGTSSGS